MIFQPTSKALNHLLAQNSWALPRLARFVGKTARFDIAPFSFVYTILNDGTLRNADAEASADAAYTIAPKLLPRLALHDEKAYDEIHSEGDAAFLAEVFFLSRNLSWDVAEDLSSITGDIAAERIVQTVQAGQQQLRGTLLNLSQATAKYRARKRTLLVKPQQMTDFIQQVGHLHDDIVQLGLRINHLLAKHKS